MDVVLCRRQRGGKPGGAGAHGFRHDRPHLLNFRWRGRSLSRRVSHDPSPHVRVADVTGEVDAEPALQHGEELGERLKLVPRDPRQRDRIHVLHFRENAFDELLIRLADRSRREAAVTRQDGRDAVKARHCRVRVKGDLRVVMGVRIHDPRRDDPSFSVDLLSRRCAVELSELHDAAVFHGNIDPTSRQPGAVHDKSVANDQVVFHPLLLSTGQSRAPCGARGLFAGPSRASNSSDREANPYICIFIRA
jgi:hypothetical protein